MLNKKALAATAAAPETDDEFNQTVLLLHGDGTNGAQNNTFTDSSTNAFSITRNGNTTQGTFSPFSQTGWSNYFDGSGDYISVPDSADFTMGSGDFTVQCWVYSNKNSSSDQYICGQVTSGGAASETSFQLYKKANTNVAECYVYIGGAKVATSSTTIPVGQWTHLAMVRDGATMRLYVNGVQDGTNGTLSTSSIVDSSGSFAVGRTGDYNGLYFDGYVSNLSVVKGTCLFPNGTTFTPSTTPLSTSTSGQSVLLCQANRFIDTNTATTAKTVTVGGNTSVQAFSPFAPTDAYSAATNGGSGYFDGSGDTLTVADTAAIRLGSSDFCVEAWVYPTSNPGFNIVMTKRVNGGDYGTFILTLNSGTFSAYASSTGSSWNVLSNASIGTATLNSWQHVAFYRSGSNWYGALNGVVTTLATGASYTLTNNTSAPFVIGGDTNDNYWNGYISSDRLVIGSAVYGASNFTPPTAPLTAVTNTQLLCNFTNAGIIDSTGKNNLETVGNAQIDTTTKKFGTGSMEFDGTGDYLKSPNSPNYNFGSGNFTIEFWMYTADVTPSVAAWFVAMFQSSSGQNSWGVRLETDGSLVGYLSSDGGESPTTITASTPGLSNDTWHHIAFVRNGSGSNNITLYVDGTSKGTGTFSSALFNSNLPVTVGIQNNTSFNQYFNGYIDDLRITKGVARYTANFTAPTKAFADQ